MDFECFCAKLVKISNNVFFIKQGKLCYTQKMTICNLIIFFDTTTPLSVKQASKKHN